MQRDPGNDRCCNSQECFFFPGIRDLKRSAHAGFAADVAGNPDDGFAAVPAAGSAIVEGCPASTAGFVVGEVGIAIDVLF
jgi:hypothetical protein